MEHIMELVVFGGFIIAAIIVAASVFEVLANRPRRGRGKQPPCPPPPPKAIDRPPRGSRLKGSYLTDQGDRVVDVDPDDFGPPAGASHAGCGETVCGLGSRNCPRAGSPGVFPTVTVPRSEVTPSLHAEGEPMHPSTEALLKHFTYEHLPPRLKEVSQHFHHLAHHLVNAQGLEGPELTMALRKLLEAKDCAVRAALE